MIEPKKNQQVVTNQTQSKKFSYKKGDCNLSFDLRVDIKTELRDFAEILKVALVEVEEELNKQK